MIFKSDFTRGDGLAKHLARTDTNTRVLIREDLSQGAPLDLALAVPFLGGFAATNPRAVRRVVHVKWSPAEEHVGSERLVLDLACERLGIRPDAPRLVAQHSKPHADGTDRPDHFHVVWPLVDVETGRAVRSHEAPLADELIARLAEIALGEPIIPGVRQREVVAILRKEGQTAIADQLSHYPAARSGERMTTGARRSLQRAGVDPKVAASQLLDYWRAADGEVAAFVHKARESGFEIRWGESVVLAVHLASEVPIPLRRALNEASKAGGDALHLTKAGCDDLFGDLPDHVGKQERRDASMLETDRNKTDHQLIQLGREALADGDGRAAARAFGAVAARRATCAIERRLDYGAILGERTREQRRANIAGRHRVERAFRHAGIFSDRRIRRLVFAAAAAGAVIAGGGLGAALIAGGVALATIPSYERARAVQFIERRNLLARYQRERGELQKHRADAIATKADQVNPLGGRGDHRLAGAYFDLLLVERRRRLRYQEKQLKSALRSALRKAKAEMLFELSRKVDPRAIGKALGFIPMRSEPDRRAVAQFLRERRQTDAADALDPLHAWIRDVSMATPISIEDGDRTERKPVSKIQDAEKTLGGLAGQGPGNIPTSEKAPPAAAKGAIATPPAAIHSGAALTTKGARLAPQRMLPRIRGGKGLGD